MSATDHAAADGQPTPDHLAAAAARALAEATGVERYEIALVLGSGWGRGAERIGQTIASIPAQDLPGFDPSPIPGHAGRVACVRVGTRGGGATHALVITARAHYYERRDPQAVAHPIRMAAQAGARIAVLTNGCGAIRPWAVGSVALLRDHINLTGATPLVGPRFVDLSEVYSARLRAVAARLFPAPALPEAVYAQFPGPQYETPAEVRAAGILGADLVGMSTALEAIAAREKGMEVLALSLVTNPAAGIGGEALNHTEVLRTGEDAADRLADMLATLVPALLEA
jgi:purine-nucleoside phosphorylase